MASDASASSSKQIKVANQSDSTPVLASFPGDLMENIISYFPIKKAVSCTLISKRFLGSWKFSRDLSFDIDFHNGAQNFNIMNRVMNEHSGPVIERLKVIVDADEKENSILDWIRKAVAKGVQELDLDFSVGSVPLLLPYDALDGARLQVLKLSFCNLDRKQYDGLRYLKTIKLFDVRVPRLFTEAIFINCLFLENFELTNCYSEFHFNADASKLENFKSLKLVHFANLLDMSVFAPSLQVFHYVGEICHITLKPKLPNLVEAVLHFNPSISINLYPGIEDLMISLKSMRRLSITSTLIERLCTRFFNFNYDELQFCLWNLREMHLCFTVSASTQRQSIYLNLYDVASFLNKSPYLEKLVIDFGDFPLESGHYWEFLAKNKFAGCDANFKFLNSLRLMNFKFLAMEMQLAKFIVRNAKVLEHCIIVKAKHFGGEEEDERDFLRWLAAEKPKTETYEHNEYKP